MGEVTTEEVKAAVNEELAKPEYVEVGGQQVPIRPLKRRWQELFRRAVLQYYLPDVAATDELRKVMEQDRSADYKNVMEIIINSEIESDGQLDEVAAIVMASQTLSDKKPDEVIAERKTWLLDNSNTQEMRALVEKQSAKERIIEDVGERLPARFVRYAHLAGQTSVTADSVKRLLTSSLPSSPDTTGAGS